MQIGNFAETHKAAASHATDFEPPIYNVGSRRGVLLLPVEEPSTASSADL
jgi:hypothetical protein